LQQKKAGLIFVHKKHPDFRLIEIQNGDVYEGSMAYEFSMDIIFHDRYNRHKVYGVSIGPPCPYEGEIWEDWINDHEDELITVKNAEEHKEVKVSYSLS
jgi:hypothetical protein